MSYSPNWQQKLRQAVLRLDKKVDQTRRRGLERLAKFDQRGGVPEWQHNARRLVYRADEMIHQSWKSGLGRLTQQKARESIHPISQESMLAVIREDMRKVVAKLSKATTELEDFARKKGWSGNSNTGGSITATLITLNAAVFGLWMLAPPSFRHEGGIQAPQGFINPNFMMRNFSCSKENLMSGRLWTLATSCFSHIQFLHFLINMFVLHSCTRVLEGVVSNRNVLALYLMTGVQGSLAHSLTSDNPGLGASGSVCGMMAFTTVLYPRMPVLLFGLLPMPQYLWLIIFTIYSLRSVRHQTGVSHSGHLGGIFTGLLMGVRYQRSGRFL